MFRFKKVLSVLTIALVLSMAAPSVLPVGNVSIAEAATVSLNHKTLTLNIGKTSKLVVKGTKKKATWTTSNKKVATVSKAGLVKAIKAGKAKITATVNKKKYICQVTVKDSNPYIANAPFDAQEVAIGKLKTVMPKDWTSKVLSDDGTTVMTMFYPASADMEKGSSNVTVSITKTGTEKQDYNLVKEYLDGAVTKDLLTSQYAQSGVDATISDFTVSDYESTLGTAYRIDYSATFTGGFLTQTIYYLFIDNYVIQLNSTNAQDDITPEVGTVGEYMLNCFSVAE